MTTRPKSGVNVSLAARNETRADTFAEGHGGGLDDYGLDRAVEAYWRKRFAHVRPKPPRVLLIRIGRVA